MINTTQVAQHFGRKVGFLCEFRASGSLKKQWYSAKLDFLLPESKYIGPNAVFVSPNKI